MAEPNAGAYVIDPGTLYIAALGSTEPTTVSSAFDVAFTKLGYTELGSTFSYTITATPHYVAEEIDPIRYKVDTRAGSVSFQLDEFTKRNLSAALNGGIVTGDNQNWFFEPPDPGSEVRVMLAWDVSSASTTNPARRFIWRQCLQTGTLAIANTKSAPSGLSVTFNLEKPTLASVGGPAAGSYKPFVVMGAGALNAS